MFQRHKPSYFPLNSYFPFNFLIRILMSMLHVKNAPNRLKAMNCYGEHPVDK